MNLTIPKRHRHIKPSPEVERPVPSSPQPNALRLSIPSASHSCLKPFRGPQGLASSAGAAICIKAKIGNVRKSACWGLPSLAAGPSSQPKSMFLIGFTALTLLLLCVIVRLEYFGPDE